MNALGTRFGRAVATLRRYGRLVRSQPLDRGASAFEWAMILVAGGTLVGVVYGAANTAVGQKALQIIGL
ncbi:hypothetical protein ACFWD7_46860 [Streptomyces mirabilis]|uniref:hypothetical protein n=1 Tax=Streptomyces mirabilis TaxID=68239 RepID=UPI00369383AF